MMDLRYPMLCNSGSGSELRPGSPISGPEDLFLAVLEAILYFFLGPPPPGDPWGGSGLSVAKGNQRFWADSGLDPGG